MAAGTDGGTGDRSTSRVLTSLRERVPVPSEQQPADADIDADAVGVALHDVLRVSSLGMCIADAAGRIVHVNPAFARIVGAAAVDLTGIPFVDLVDDDGAAAIDGLLRRVASGDTTTSRIECRVPRATEGGAVDVDVLVSASVLPTNSGPQLVLELHDLSERRAAEAALLRQAMHDPLTGLPNRVLFMDRLRLMISRGARTSTVTAVMFIDLDDFKDVNDGHGHKVGDAVLIEIARRLTEVVRPFDTVTRLGGDEFVILCLDLPSVSDAAGIASRLLRAIAHPVVVGQDDEVVVTSSIGIALATDDSASAEVVLHEADSAMYRAKSRGKNEVEIFDDSVRSSVSLRIRTEALLRQGLRDELFRVHYQPIYDLATGELVAVESLVRVDLGDGQLLPPGQFIDVAEHSGLIIPIGAWVLGESCRQLAEWRRDGIVAPSVRVAVNLSVRQVARSDLFKTVNRALAESGLEPSALSLELTESILMEADS
ncbi:MAG: hypothetical protein QOF57_11, partial [Frankiaceae bacterium]|nr:hypothetical protein [Frankiaceae bacterium]